MNEQTSDARSDPEGADLSGWRRYASDLIDAMHEAQKTTYTSFDVAPELYRLTEHAIENEDKIVLLLNEDGLRDDPRVIGLGREFAADVAHAAALTDAILKRQRELTGDEEVSAP